MDLQAITDEWTSCDDDQRDEIRGRIIRKENAIPEVRAIRDRMNGLKHYFNDCIKVSDGCYYSQIVIIPEWKIERANGGYCKESNTLYLAKYSDQILLHELTHYHLYKMDPAQRGPYYIDLLKRVGKEIPYISILLGERDLAAAHLGKFFPDPVCHNNLFFVKSLDLDLKNGYPLGTVFGYGMAKEIKNILDPAYITQRIIKSNKAILKGA